MVQLVVFMWRCELQQKLANLLVDGMVPQGLEVSYFGSGLFSEDFAEVVEGLEGLLCKAFMNLLKNIAKF